MVAGEAGMAGQKKERVEGEKKGWVKERKR
jgi:hypothetical protein